MSNKITDTQLTAYALGEMDAEQIKIVEQAIKDNPELQKEIESIQAMAQLLKNELAKEPLPVASEKSRISKQLSEKKGSWNFMGGWQFKLGATLATALAVVLLMKPVVENQLEGKLSQLGGQIQSFPADESLQQSPPSASAAQAVAMNEQEVAAAPMAELDRADFAKGAAPAKAKIASAKIAKRSAVAMNDQMIQPSANTWVAEDRAEVKMGGRDERYESYPKEFYGKIHRNPFLTAKSHPLSTFSVDVDTASYTNIRRYLTRFNQMPPADAVRIEEMVNYFDYADPSPTDNSPFSVNWEVTDSPWSSTNKLVRVALKGKVPPANQKKKANLVFLVDVSGSMEDHDKLPLLKVGFHKLIESLGENDKVAIVTYADSSAVVLPPTNGSQKRVLHEAIDKLAANGSTNGEGGIRQAYDLARQNFIKDGINRVILATDGDFNVGIQSPDELDRFIQDQAKSKVFLTILGFGTGNLQDGKMESMSNKGNGNYFYIDSEKEAEKVLVKGLRGTIETIAKDVKIQIEFNPENVVSYRLIGYESRLLKAKDFNDDKKDAGEIGSGHSVVAIYEITTGTGSGEGVDPLKYQKADAAKPKSSLSKELLTLKLRYKEPNSDTSIKREYVLNADTKQFQQASPDMKWTAGVAGFGMLLSNSEHKGDLTYNKVLNILESGRWNRQQSYDGQRAELVEMVKKAKAISGQE